MLGPVAGWLMMLLNWGRDTAQCRRGKPEQTGGDLVKLGKGLIPGANLWYAKAALDHMIFNQLQEYFSLAIFVKWNSVPAKSLTKHTGGAHRTPYRGN
jgi:fermentation-respiration switch protein FrsA (DUF1100 family)